MKLFSNERHCHETLVQTYLSFGFESHRAVIETGASHPDRQPQAHGLERQLLHIGLFVFGQRGQFWMFHTQRQLFHVQLLHLFQEHSFTLQSHHMHDGFTSHVGHDVVQLSEYTTKSHILLINHFESCTIR